MRRLSALVAALLVVTASTAFAQGEPPKPDTTKAKPAAFEGKWSGSVSTEGGNQEVWATIKKDADGKYSGTTGSQMGETAFYDMKVAGDTVSAGATMQTPNGNFDLWYTLVLKGDALGGSIDLNIQGQKMSFPIVFKRQP
jgi:hypothetical protein